MFSQLRQQFQLGFDDDEHGIGKKKEFAQSDKGLRLETSASLSLYDGNLTLQVIILYQISVFHFPTDAESLSFLWKLTFHLFIMWSS